MAFLSTTGAGLAVDAVRNSAIPIFATDDRTGWQLDRTFGVDDLIALPGGGPGPVTFDKAHPYAPPGRPVPTYRVADLSNPILHWVKPGMKKANDEVIAGGVAYRAHERCWPAGVPTFDTDVVGACPEALCVSGDAERIYQDFRFLSDGLDDVPALLFGSGDE